MQEYVLKVALGLGRGVIEEKSRKSRNFSIISYRDSILPLCMA